MLRGGASGMNIYTNCPGWMSGSHGDFVLVDGKQRVDAVCKFLGRPDIVCDPARVQLIRQATSLNRAWRARFLAEQAEGKEAL